MNSLFQAFAMAADGVVIINEAKDIIYWNQAAEEILGYPPDEVVGRPCYRIIEGRDNQGRLVCHECCRVATTALTGGAVTNFDSCIRTQSGDLRWINVSTLTLPTNGAQAGPVLVHLFRDVTKTKKNEQFINQVLAAAKQLGNREPSPLVPAEPEKQDQTVLTDREREVLTLLAQGLSTHEIADWLSISPATTRNHIRNILQKFQVHSRLEAVVYALEHGYISRN